MFIFSILSNSNQFEKLNLLLVNRPTRLLFCALEHGAMLYNTIKSSLMHSNITYRTVDGSTLRLALMLPSRPPRLEYCAGF